MSWRLINWIWHIRGSLSLGREVSSDEAFARLDPLFQQEGTTYDREGDTLTFRKKDQAAQDKMSIFDGGVLSVEDGDTSPELKYDLKSRALLACFIAPLVFLAFAQFSIVLSSLDTGCADGDRVSEQCVEEAAEKEEEDEEEETVKELHPIDKFLGAPAPKQPDEDEKEESEDAEEEEKEKMKHSPLRAYIFAGIFSMIYIVGRVLESWLINRRFRKRLFPEAFAAPTDQSA